MRSSVRVRRVQLIFSLGTCGRKGGRGRQAGVADARLTDAVQPINTTSTSPRRQRPSAEAEAAQADVRHAAMSGHYAYTNRFRLGKQFCAVAVACGAGGPEPHEQLGPENNGSMADEEKRRNRRAKQGLTEEQVRATVRQPAKLRAQSMAAPGRLRR